MGKINWGRVIMGGLLAGVVLNLSDWLVNGVWLVNDWNAAMRAMGKVDMSMSLIWWFILTDLVLGIFIVWLYADMRPRYGAGPNTAAWAGFATWFLIVLVHALGESPVGMIPMRLYVLPGLAALIFMPLAAVAGAWLYREEMA